MRYASSKEDAKEFLNIGFYKILTKLNQHKLDNSFLAWIKRIMINSIIDEMRKNKRYKDHVALIEATELQWKVESSQNWFDSAAISKEEIYLYISELPPLTGSVFNLFAIDGYKHKEISEKLGISLSASKWHYVSAKEKLQSRILKVMKLKRVNIL